MTSDTFNVDELEIDALEPRLEMVGLPPSTCIIIHPGISVPTITPPPSTCIPF